MTDSTSARGGVFLSYAREDTDPARRIADALRGFGIEVWFDQSELRGGDEWDAKIKRQIRECALFVPVVSASSQARGEGYFRREWKLAIERTHDMAAGIPFLVPVVIDQTPEAKALVPEEFMRVQWTRLPGGLPTPQFVERVKRLIEVPAIRSDKGMGPILSTEHTPTAAPKKKGIPGWAWGAVAGIAIAAVAYFGLSRRTALPAAEAKAEAPSHSGLKASDKSVAVLPFANMSDEKDNEFFTDGIQEDILTNLALVHEIRVISRTSVMQYRDTKKSIGQIASELGVSYVLEGSVRRAGNKVRVTGQLIQASTDQHVWAKAYDRDLTDIFAIQSEVAQAIAHELQAALSPQEKAMLENRPTANTAAYDFYLKARRASDSGDRSAGAPLLEKAVALDPTFARAWGLLAEEYAFGAFSFREGMDEMLTKAKAAIDRALQLAPEDPEVISSLGTYYYYGYRDYARANEQYQRLARQRPNDAGVFNSLGLIARRQGKWAESLADMKRATELDVANIRYLSNLISVLEEARRYDELAIAWRKMAALRPDDFTLSFDGALVSFHAHGSTREVEDFLAHLSPEEAASHDGITIRARWAAIIGDFPELVRLRRLQPYDEKFTSLAQWEQELFTAQVLFLTGDKVGATARLGHIPEELAQRLEHEPKNPRHLAFQAIVDLVQGRPADAVRASERSVELIPASLDAVQAPLFAAFRAAIYDHTGNTDRALAEYARLFRTPGTESFLNVYEMKLDTLSSLHGDPRFEALLNDPANNAPLF
jgi:TolB-like protein/cytochrome c-type biogenesis protein CcmH/NrfG